MDCEKKYKEALEKAKIWQEHLYEVGDKDYADELNYIFPELCESENEIIKKELINYLKHRCNSTALSEEVIECNKWIAWLEKKAR